MPGHTEATKAAVSCDKPGGGAHTLRSPGGRMGQPGSGDTESSRVGVRRTLGTETSQYREEEEATCEARSSGERNGPIA